MPPAALTVITPVPPFIVIGVVIVAFAPRAAGSLTVAEVEAVQPLASVTSTV